MTDHTHEIRREDDGAVTLVLAWPRNPIPANGQRGTWYAHARRVREVRTLAAGFGQATGLRLETADVALTWFVTDQRRRDADNLMPVMKALVDGLVTAHVIPDDNDRILSRQMPRIRYEPSGPARMELTIRPTRQEA